MTTFVWSNGTIAKISRRSSDKSYRKSSNLDPNDLIKTFNRTLGAKDVGAYQYFNCGFSECQIENWQIISPVNGYGYGVKEINKLVQTTFRKSFIDSSP